jgi:hypothetical protein
VVYGLHILVQDKVVKSLAIALSEVREEWKGEIMETI